MNENNIKLSWNEYQFQINNLLESMYKMSLSENWKESEALQLIEWGAEIFKNINGIQ
jgi:hypothetical protein